MRKIGLTFRIFTLLAIFLLYAILEINHAIVNIRSEKNSMDSEPSVQMIFNNRSRANAEEDKQSNTTVLKAAPGGIFVDLGIISLRLFSCPQINFKNPG